MMETAFWIALLGLVYTWAGYPALLSVVSRKFPTPPGRRTELPAVSVIVAAYNEATVIDAKIRSTLEQRYPADRLELLVVSDGSEDGTDELVAGHPDPRVRLLRQEPRQGKSVALNRAAAAASGEILLFTDANATFGPDAIAHLVAALDDSRVALASGQGLYAAGADDPRAVANGYVRFEAFLRRAESRLGFLAGADGAVYALRRELYRDLGAAEPNDLVHPIQVALAGRQSRFTPEAITVEPPSRDAAQEFRRHVRMVAQGAAIVRRWAPRLAARRRWRELWMLLSHRALRWCTAPLLAVVLVSSAALASEDTVYSVALTGQYGFYALALLGLVAERRRWRLGRLAIPYYFCVVAAAGVLGLVRCLTTGAESVWAPTGQPAATDRLP